MNIQQLRERYAAPEIPKCRVCGGELTVQRTGGGPTIWGCTGMVDDPTGERNWIYAEGRSCADEHYERSRWSDYRQGGDAEVIELIDALESAERERDELRKTLQATQGGATEAIKHAMRLQEDIARRDAAAGEPVVIMNVSKNSSDDFQFEIQKRLPDGVYELYTAALPAVVPPAISTEGFDPESKDIDEVRNLAHIVGANWMRHHCLELGAQQQKAVVLQGGSLKSDGKIWYDAGKLVETFRKAGIEVKP